MAVAAHSSALATLPINQLGSAANTCAEVKSGRQELIDTGHLPGISSGDQAELVAA